MAVWGQMAWVIGGVSGAEALSEILLSLHGMGLGEADLSLLTVAAVMLDGLQRGRSHVHIVAELAWVGRAAKAILRVARRQLSLVIALR